MRMLDAQSLVCWEQSWKVSDQGDWAPHAPVPCLATGQQVESNSARTKPPGDTQRICLCSGGSSLVLVGKRATSTNCDMISATRNELDARTTARHRQWSNNVWTSVQNMDDGGIEDLGEGVKRILRRHFQMEETPTKNRGPNKKHRRLARALQANARSTQDQARRQQEQHNSTKTTQSACGLYGRMITR